MTGFDLPSIVLGALVMFSFGATITARLFKHASEMMKDALDLMIGFEAMLDEMETDDETK